MIAPPRTDNIRKKTESQLTDNSTTRSGDFDSSADVVGNGAVEIGALPVDYPQHAGYETNGEDVVSVGEETNTGHDDGADVVPAERSFVDLCKRESSPLVGVRDVCILVVEVVEG